LNFDEATLQADVEIVSRITVVPTILEVICRTTGMGFAAVARVTEEKWIACSVRDEIQFGLEAGGELKLETTICNEIRQSGEGVIIDHVDADEHFCGHHTPAMYGFQSYISIPIIRQDGTFFGTLCAIDPRPAKLNTPEIIGMFKMFAELISFHLNSHERLFFTEEKLREERKTAELREQFIAILGHDLRNPIGAVLNGAQMLKRMPLDERSMRVANIIYDSSFRMRGLVENILDFALGRMGGGINLRLSTDEPLEHILDHVVAELSMLHPNRAIENHFSLTAPVLCDGKRIAQLFSNILGNALKHGKNDTPVIVKAESNENEFILSVSNSGKKIPAASMTRLFQPFSRGEVKPGQDGLGLGLFISAEIAKAHNGTLEVTSTDAETCFTFRIPVVPRN
jgi:signal transduction histidine kinase